MKIARTTIAAALIIGVGVFGVFAINDLRLGVPVSPAQPDDFGALKPGDPDAAGNLEPDSDNPFVALAQLRPDQYIPIKHHPGKIEPFFDATAFLQPPYRQAGAGPFVIENCAYRVVDATPQQALDHYNTHATAKGLKLTSLDPTSNQRPGGIKARWTDGISMLMLTAWPTENAPPTPAPLKPKTPLDWVVQYSYPETITSPGK